MSWCAVRDAITRYKISEKPVGIVTICFDVVIILIEKIAGRDPSAQENAAVLPIE